jgi:hypothetical protein
MEDDEEMMANFMISATLALLGFALAILGFVFKASNRGRQVKLHGLSNTLMQPRSALTKLELVNELRGVFIYQVVTAAIAKTAKSSMKIRKSLLKIL